MKLTLIVLLSILSIIAHESWIFTLLMVFVLGKIMVNDLRKSGWRI
jgi:hypothetical protein